MFFLLFAAILNIETYYLSEQKNSEQVDVATKLISTAEADINIEIFRRHDAVKFKTAAITSLARLDSQVYSDKNTPKSLDLVLFRYLVLPTLPPKSKEIDLRIIFSSLPLVHCYEVYETDRGSLYFGPVSIGCGALKGRVATEIIGGQLISDDTIIVGNIQSVINRDSEIKRANILSHELGHFVGIKTHADEDVCKQKPLIMCGTSGKDAKYIIFDESYKKAWRDFYYQKTGQRLEPSK
ncbi:hypothetical protein A2926_02445 [Candidatus Giovannonibacteria bacterium RIFCSPLOWO2_01_FULL_44_40]|uniref:Uncharacterized protein n=1 Tax=Candidatus Giovannonibacteria bacterium RIFCSPHIGHO2_01_FULL_45_23 TaxID=1798325 RepID=A0A1F5VHP0_9BACT|nr:MAG: hypothetical protein A2834_02560 [Candidatus Giovannonibacteria bacterium RIFCSPHIGHO2_01_FULL_45_23]OGF75589.1 MAG: hypothetical protein A3C77_02045 [Candidatus Giovannonibacteria bacterium RIFCSPHIGHO2_02_FULL_45_13]OGF80008.1 MAG: hypothetical protein A2926_02445 [Candidatus Giovannonibacteria bacterium RIFCSPLOWO2_01_FULL_44_40]